MCLENDHCGVTCCVLIKPFHLFWRQIDTTMTPYCCLFISSRIMMRKLRIGTVVFPPRSTVEIEAIAMIHKHIINDTRCVPVWRSGGITGGEPEVLRSIVGFPDS